MPLYPEDVTSEITHEIVEETGRLPVFFSTPNRGACREYCCNTLTIPLHWHEYIEFIYICGDTMRAIVQNNTYDLKAGDLLVINSGELHSTKITNPPGNYILMQMCAKRMEDLFPDFKRLVFDNYISKEKLENTPRLKEMIIDMERLFDEGESEYELLFISRLHEFLYELHKNYCHKIASDTIDYATGRDKKIISEIIEWTQQHLSYRIL